MKKANLFSMWIRDVDLEVPFIDWIIKWGFKLTRKEGIRDAPYPKPPQVTECKCTKAIERTTLKELGKLPP
jgi:hypothetical protein